MIDQLLINQNINSAQTSLLGATNIGRGLYQIANVLTEDMILKLKSYIISESAQPWESEFNHYGSADHNNHRKKLAWHTDTVIEELHTVCDNLGSGTTDKFALANYKFLGITLWKDEPRYWLDWHVDNTVILASLQLYLFGDNCPGTTFDVDGVEHSIPFESNNGYLAYHTGTKLQHKVSWPVPPHTVRYSLFAMWTQPS